MRYTKYGLTRVPSPCWAPKTPWALRYSHFRVGQTSMLYSYFDVSWINEFSCENGSRLSKVCAEGIQHKVSRIQTIPTFLPQMESHPISPLSWMLATAKAFKFICFLLHGHVVWVVSTKAQSLRSITFMSRPLWQHFRIWGWRCEPWMGKSSTRFTIILVSFSQFRWSIITLW